ncbi:MAG: threonine/serine exporter family protein [Eubacteriales bacterium]
MIEFIIINVLCSAVGTISFAVLYNVPKQYYVGCGITGAAGWLMYCLIVGNDGSITMASFWGTVLVVLMSRVLAVYMKCPITIFLVSGIFPLIPGSSVYYTAYYIVMNELSEAALKGILALKIAFAISLAIVFVVSIPKQWFVWESLMRKLNK